MPGIPSAVRHNSSSQEEEYEYAFDGQKVRKTAVITWSLEKNCTTGLHDLRRGGLLVRSGFRNDCLNRAKQDGVRWKSIDDPMSGSALGRPDSRFSYPDSYVKLARISAAVKNAALESARRGAEACGGQLGPVADYETAAYLLHLVSGCSWLPPATDVPVNRNGARLPSDFDLLVALCEQALLPDTSNEILKAVRARSAYHDECYTDYYDEPDVDEPGVWWQFECLIRAIQSPADDPAKLVDSPPFVREPLGEPLRESLFAVFRMFNRFVRWLDRQLRLGDDLAKQPASVLEDSARAMQVPSD